MSQQLISIIIPVYNAEKYLSECIHSVLEQTYPHFEIICVDDGSTDNSVNILKSINDPRLKIIQQPNQGVSTARNTGIGQAQGEFLTFLDSDDVLDPHFFEILLNAYNQYHSPVVGCGYKVFKDSFPAYKSLKEISVKYYKSPLFRYLLHMMKYHTTVWGKLYHRSVFEKLRFDPQMSYGEDTHLSLEVLIQLPTLSFVRAPLYGYRNNALSLTQSPLKPKMIDDHILSFLKLTSFIQGANISQFWRLLLERKQTNRCFRWFCFKPYQKKSDEYQVLWEKYLPVINDLVKQKKFKPSYLRLNYRFLFFLWRHKFWKILRIFI